MDSLSACVGPYVVVEESTHARSPLAIDRAVIGRRLPMLRSAAGRCYLAYCRAPERAALLHVIARSKVPENVPYLKSAQLSRLLAETAERGYGVRYSESYVPETSSIAVPLYSEGSLIGSIAVIWATKALTLEEAVSQFLAPMRDAAPRINERHRLVPTPDKETSIC